jgi:hypothetical protein
MVTGTDDLSLPVESLELGSIYYWMVVPVTSDGVYGPMNDVVWTFTVSEFADMPVYDMELYPISDITLEVGESTQASVNLTNKGSGTDSFALTLDTGSLGTQVSIVGSSEIALGSGDSTVIVLSITLTNAAEPGDYPIKVKVVSLKAEENKVAVSDEIAFVIHVVGSGGGESSKEGEGLELELVVLIVVAVIIAIIVLVLLTKKKREKAREEKEETEKGEISAISIDIIKPEPGKTVKALPVGVIDTHAEVRTADGTTTKFLSPSPVSTAAGPDSIPSNRLLPKAPVEAVPTKAESSEEKADIPDGRPDVSATQPAALSTTPLALPVVQPVTESPPFGKVVMAQPLVPGQQPQVPVTPSALNNMPPEPSQEA